MLSNKVTRRDVSLLLVSAPLLTALTDGQDRDFSRRVLGYIESMRCPKVHSAAYRYASSSPEPVVYASVYAVLTRDLFGDLDHLTDSQRAAWVEYLQSHQGPDGLFRDPLLKSDLADSADWWGWRHLTNHAYWAYAALGAIPRIPPLWLDPILSRDGLKRWLDSLDWGKGVADSSNIIMNWGVGLLYSGDTYNNRHAADMAMALLDELDSRANAVSGLWGPEDCADYSTEVWRSLRVQAAYHLWLLYSYRKRNPPKMATALHSVLATQNPNGGFGWGIHNPKHPFLSSACEDIDSIDPLARFSSIAPELSSAAVDAMLKARPWVESNFDSKGGAVFCKGEPFFYGHPRMSTSAGEPSMFATWFRTLSLAFIDTAVRKGRRWRFVNVPGCQQSPMAS